MIRRKLTRIELQLDDTKELDELFSKPVIIPTNFFNLASHRAFQNPSAIEKQLQSEIVNNSQQQQQQQQEAIQIATTSNNNPSTNESQERIGYNPQPYNSSTRFQFNQSGIR